MRIVQYRISEMCIGQITVEHFGSPQAAAVKGTVFEVSFVCTKIVHIAVDKLRSLKLSKAHACALHIHLFQNSVPEDGVVELHSPHIEA